MEGAASKPGRCHILGVQHKTRHHDCQEAFMSNVVSAAGNYGIICVMVGRGSLLGA